MAASSQSLIPNGRFSGHFVHFGILARNSWHRKSVPATEDQSWGRTVSPWDGKSVPGKENQSPGTDNQSRARDRKSVPRTDNQPPGTEHQSLGTKRKTSPRHRK